MIKKFCAVLLVAWPGIIVAQQSIDTNTISAASKLLDLNFTHSEKDSMLNALSESRKLYQEMHQSSLSNSAPYPFAFKPVPQHFVMPVAQTLVTWNIDPSVKLPRNKADLAFYSVLQLASLVKYKKISSVELTRFFIDRLKKWGDTLECVITLTEELALQQAKNADEQIAGGHYLGPLHGIPYGLKDLFAVKGFKTTWGAVPYKDQVIEEDAYVYTRLKEAGAVLCAKLTLGELAYNDLWFGGKTRNPWDLRNGSSGSSAGSAAAASAGLLPFTIGTETLGSIVSPSHTCGATGLRPTFGSVSRSGAMVLCWSLDKTGPICRSAEDAAVVFYYLKGTDGKDAGAVERPFNYNGKADFSKLRIAYAGNYFKQLDTGSLQRKVLEVYETLGATVRAVDFPDSAMYPINLVEPILGAESAAAFDELTRNNRDDLIRRQDKDFWPNIFRVSRFIPAVEYINANRHRSALISKMNAFMKDFDVLIVPTFAGSQLSITNLTGHPVVVFPVGFSARGLPESITLVGNLYDEATILAVAKAYQDATPHNKKHPEKFKQ